LISPRRARQFIRFAFHVFIPACAGPPLWASAVWEG
jgi:hypothetical protein